jgi:hypothetical protein
MDFYISLNRRCNALAREVDLTGYEVAAIDVNIPLPCMLHQSNFEIEVYKKEKNSYIKHPEINLELSDVSRRHFVEAIEKSLKEYATIDVSTLGHFTITNKPDVRLILSRTLTKSLGMGNAVIDSNATSIEPICPERLITNVTILTNFVESFYCNGSYLPCIYMGPPNHHGEGHIRHKSLDKAFGCFDIRFLNFAQEEIHLQDGSFTILFHFRKVLKH